MKTKHFKPRNTRNTRKSFFGSCSHVSRGSRSSSAQNSFSVSLFAWFAWFAVALSASAQISSNKTFMLNNGLGNSNINNRLVPANSNFFAVNGDLLSNAVSQYGLFGSGGPPGLSPNGPPH